MHHLAGQAEGQTPLDPDEAAGLIPSWVTTRGDLDRAEQENITAAITWSTRRRFRTTDVVSEPFLRQLHKRMFGDVWKWAGVYRTTAKNIGVDSWRIAEEIGQLLGNVSHWIAEETFSRDEIALRFHYGIAWIHPFPNGNGRLSRLAADILVEASGGQRFSWGHSLVGDPARARREYLEAIWAADRGGIEALLTFARR